MATIVTKPAIVLYSTTEFRRVRLFMLDNTPITATTEGSYSEAGEASPSKEHEESNRNQYDRSHLGILSFSAHLPLFPLDYALGNRCSELTLEPESDV